MPGADPEEISHVPLLDQFIGSSISTLCSSAQLRLGLFQGSPQSEVSIVRHPCHERVWARIALHNWESYPALTSQSIDYCCPKGAHAARIGCSECVRDLPRYFRSRRVQRRRTADCSGRKLLKLASQSFRTRNLTDALSGLLDELGESTRNDETIFFDQQCLRNQFLDHVRSPRPARVPRTPIGAIRNRTGLLATEGKRPSAFD